MEPILACSPSSSPPLTVAALMISSDCPAATEHSQNRLKSQDGLISLSDSCLDRFERLPVRKASTRSAIAPNLVKRNLAFETPALNAKGLLAAPRPTQGLVKKPCNCSHSPNRSIHRSEGRFCFRIPNPCPPFEYMCSSTGFRAANHLLYTLTLSGASPSWSSEAAATNIGAASFGTSVSFTAPI